MRSIGVLGTGAFVPTHIVSNNDLVSMGLDTSDDWIKDRSGISERRIAKEDETSSDLAFEASLLALKSSGCVASDIDGVIVATSSSDYSGFPSVACQIQSRLGISNGFAFDVAAACTGFNYALSVSSSMIQTGMATKVLVVASDVLSQIVDWSDRGTCVLFGDGAGAVVLGDVQDGFGLLYSKLYADGNHGEILSVEKGDRLPFDGSEVIERDPVIKMAGRSVYKVAVEAVQSAVELALKDSGLSVQDLSAVVFHQANLRIMSAIGDRLGLPGDKILTTIEKYGNTSAASIPITLDDGIHNGKIKAGDIVLTVGFGGGFTWGVNILKMGGNK